MNDLRRLVLKATAASGALACGIGSVVPRAALAQAAEDWNRAAFESKSIADALKNIGVSAATESAEILIKAPQVAENGALIPIEVTSRFPGTEFIALLAEKNIFPLVALAEFTESAEGYLNTRIKMGESSVVRAVAKAGGRHYFASREIKVTIGGCGG